ncbi:MAG: putative selenium-dependent hydroxylase accessory protein YqeC [Anaerolineae bacterium]|nr:putative selenium-dependent hydroxylase accessory protein YqeC [Anaerolineae bacterium]
MRLCDALAIGRGEIVAFVGAGGKTSALLTTGRELTTDGWRVLATTTTRIAEAELALAPASLAVGDDLEGRLADIWRLLSLHRFVFVYRHVSDGKAFGLAPDAVDWLADRMNSDALLVEADGARRLPFKTPRAREPVIPAGTTLVVPVAGLDVIGQPLDAAHVYNPAPLTEIYGFPPGMPVYAAWVAQALRHPEIGLRGAPPGARVVLLLNKADDPVRRAQGQAAARIALRPHRGERGRLVSHIHSTVIGSMVHPTGPALEVRRRVGAVVLAAGRSTRMGRSKVLLPWDGRTVIASIVERLKAADLSEVVVVTGHEHAAVEGALNGLHGLGGAPVQLAHNPDYRSGEMISSFQTGLCALSEGTSACLLVLGDQPLLSPRVMWQVLEAYARGTGRSIVAPSFGRRRGHPVLFDRMHWPELLALKPGEAPRDLLGRYAVYHVPVNSASILQDIDTPADYVRARRAMGMD